MAAGRPRLARYSRRAGTVLVVLGLGLLVWSFVVWRWSDPITSVYTAWEQHRLDDQLARLMRDRPPAPAPVRPRPTPRADALRIETEARAFRTSRRPGTAIGRLVVPRLDLDMVMVEGTDTASLRKGPGRDERTYMPGEGRLVYVAGHRTTYSAPFAHIDRLRPGDRVTMEMPYGTFVYAVSRHRIVDDEDLSVLAPGGREEIALQACHPRFFATERYIVWADPVSSTELDGRSFARAVPRDGGDRGVYTQ